MEIQAVWPDGSIRRVLQGTTIAQVAESMEADWKKTIIAGAVNGTMTDLDEPFGDGSRIDMIAQDSPEGLHIYRHSTAHVLAQAIKRLYGRQAVKLGIGPVIEDGFYYDVELDHTLSTKDLEAIEQEMRVIIKENWPIKRQVVSREEALSIFSERKEPLKLELIRDLPSGDIISIYEQGEFADLCRGPHLPSTGRIKAFKLLHVAGAYWRGDSNNQMLQRIYGTAFLSKSDLADYLHRLEEAKKRDHRKLGRELELFMFSEEAPGIPFYLPKGMAVRTALENFSRELLNRNDYEEVRTPFMMNKRMWEQSGHWDHYKDNMYFTQVDEAEFALKPMNCPGHMLIFKNSLRSYRELPIRLAEFGQVHRHELSGALGGMMRVRTFCQDDAHLFVRPDQIEEEIGKVMALIDDVYKVFGFDYSVELSTRPADHMGSEELWDEAEQSLNNVLDARGMSYRVNEGDGAFYGPKIDFHIVDALKRSWQCGTIQLDFQMPEKFDLSYIGEDNKKQRPVVIHRAVYGSLDRFIGILIEHYSGAFPIWLAPVQAKIIPVSEHELDYALQVKAKLIQAGIRVEVDARSEKLGNKIRKAQLEKVPYMLVVGKNERLSGSVSVRKRGEADAAVSQINSVAGSILEELHLRR
ncbi:threonine--tRNA ligase [Paenibacillus glycanilyticus]|uniref:threonine--tRNA ligase n=1 Tax=Paenibacillus glycanilyticus TaxID=126569 RepID=UPI002042578D|nr:threonine--tRNA ligase [Paenibacillus glycanilyticus]MCM3630932.1 threonine--tRNA ligase [Paenibacillus glycanilyticus]